MSGQINEELLASLAVYKKWLFRGDQKAIARECGKSVPYTSLVLTAKYYNKEIIEKARQKAIENARAAGVEIS